jgi:hypothetical protein
MLAPIAWIVAGYAALVTVAAGLGVALRAPRPSWLDQLAWMLEVLAVVLARAGLASLGQGDPPESLFTFIGYLVALVGLVPIAMQSVQGDRGTWSSGVIAITALAVGVIAVRVMMTR